MKQAHWGFLQFIQKVMKDFFFFLDFLTEHIGAHAINSEVNSHCEHFEGSQIYLKKYVIKIMTKSIFSFFR